MSNLPVRVGHVCRPDHVSRMLYGYWTSGWSELIQARCVTCGCLFAWVVMHAHTGGGQP